MILLFNCVHCGFPPHASSFPLCENCLNSLRPSPELCAQCGASRCSPEECFSPWQKSSIHGYFAAYLLIEPGYSVLKRWKKRKGTAFTRRILSPDRLDPGGRLRKDHEGDRQTPLKAIVPVPQTFDRAWRLGGSPALEISESLGKLLQVPVLDALKPRLGNRKRQAELSMAERLAEVLRFEIKEGISIPESVLLVDDFMTTGQTLRSAALSLKFGGARRIRAYCLGVRIAHSDFE
jgi:predicted amidophosphoribosyltransferase